MINGKTGCVDLGSAFGSTYLDKAFAEGGELEKSACSSAVSHVVRPKRVVRGLGDGRL